MRSKGRDGIKSLPNFQKCKYKVTDKEQQQVSTVVDIMGSEQI